jgi:hypothetical protein
MDGPGPKPVAQECVLIGRLRSPSGYVNEIHIRDLSIGGCLIVRRSLPIRVDDRVLVSLPQLRSLPARVIWIEEGEAALAFEEALYEPVVEHLRQQFVAVLRD